MIFRTKSDNQIALSPCSESETRRNWGSVRKIWNTVISNRGGNPTVPIGSLILWTRTLAEKPHCYVLADGIQNSIANGGSGIDYTGVFIKLDSVDPGTAVAASSTSSDSAGTASGTTNSVTLTAVVSGTTSSTSAGTASGTTSSESAGTPAGEIDVEDAHTHNTVLNHGHNLSGWQQYTVKSGSGTTFYGASGPTSVAVDGHTSTVTSNGGTEHDHEFAGDSLGSHSHSFGGVTFGAHTHTFSDTDVGVGTSGEDNHNHTFSSTLSGHSHTSGSPAATTIIPLEYIGC